MAVLKGKAAQTVVVLPSLPFLFVYGFNLVVYAIFNHLGSKKCFFTAGLSLTWPKDRGLPADLFHTYHTRKHIPKRIHTIGKVA